MKRKYCESCSWIGEVNEKVYNCPKCGEHISVDMHDEVNAG